MGILGGVVIGVALTLVVTGIVEFVGSLLDRPSEDPWS